MASGGRKRLCGRNAAPHPPSAMRPRTHARCAEHVRGSRAARAAPPLRCHEASRAAAQRCTPHPHRAGWLAMGKAKQPGLSRAVPGVGLRVKMIQLLQ